MFHRRDGWTAHYFDDRDKVAGRRWWIHRDPDIAAHQLAEHLGGREPARQWLRDALAALGR
jgi:hypothetical protein